ncbi:MAG TPA: BTAD domain-containing putative transcriptional regulator [Candidatus Limnocylindrales bacterium]|nr:BTAD domain-containing putative transcriptional regulator [Candidatus Limnocylindrales bacterium]
MGAAHTTLSVRLFGRLEVLAGDIQVRVTGRHAQALTALLALRPRPRLRDAIAAELWPDVDGPSAASLRQALWLLRSSLANAGLDPDAWVEADQDTLGLRSGATLDLDVERFERLVETADCPADESAALRLYRGDLLEGLGHECFAAERERLSDCYEDLLARVAIGRLARGDVAGARLAATELLGRDALREEAHAVLIAAYGLAGTRSQVVRQYRRVCAILRSELAVSPLPETDAAYRMALAAAASRSRERAASILYDPTPFIPILVNSA